MNAARAKQTTCEWIAANVEHWPGLRAAHLVGGITTMPDDAPFPSHKDVDVHLIFDEGSPALQQNGLFPNLIEASYGSLAIEAGIKSVADYRSAESVLSNAEIAHHLTVDSLLYDPSGLLGNLQAAVRRDYRRRRWVLARIEFDWKELARAFDLRPFAAQFGPMGEASLLGYSTMRPGAALNTATLSAPSGGGRRLLTTRRILAAHDRLDLYHELVALLGLQRVGRPRVEQLLLEGIEAFDLAIEIKTSPHMFQHKLQRHLRPYFVETCRGMLDEGYHAESLFWILPYHLHATDVILADGPATEQPKFAERRATLLQELGFDAADARAAKFERATRLYDQIFTLAREMVARHPDIVD
ncbi:MAG: hypothetical protein ACRDJW_00255 [Thermomicrobiales bacterium]